MQIWSEEMEEGNYSLIKDYSPDKPSSTFWHSQSIHYDYQKKLCITFKCGDHWRPLFFFFLKWSHLALLGGTVTRVIISPPNFWLCTGITFSRVGVQEAHSSQGLGLNSVSCMLGMCFLQSTWSYFIGHWFFLCFVNTNDLVVAQYFLSKCSFLCPGFWNKWLL